MKFYLSALVGVIIKVILQSARCDNKGTDPNFRTVTRLRNGRPMNRGLILGMDKRFTRLQNVHIASVTH